MGCSGQSEPAGCAVFTPWGLREEDVLTEAAANTPDESFDAVTAGFNLGKTLNTGTILNWTWAIWSLAAQQEGIAPEPPTSACLLLAAGLAFAMSRRRKRNTSVQ